MARTDKRDRWVRLLLAGLVLLAVFPAQAFSIRVDCRLSDGFCTAPDKHNVLQMAAQVWADLIVGDFPEIASGQTLRFTDLYTKEPFRFR